MGLIELIIVMSKTEWLVYRLFCDDGASFTTVLVRIEAGRIKYLVQIDNVGWVVRPNLHY